MNKNYQILFTPMKIGRCEIRNRVILSPMEKTALIDWMFGCRYNDKVEDFFLEAAENGVGLIIPGMMPLRSCVGNRWLYQNPQMFEPVKPLMDKIHARGAKLFVQLGAGFGRAFPMTNEMLPLAEHRDIPNPMFNMNDILVSASETPDVWLPQVACRPLTTEEIQEYVQAYAKTALLCKQSGVDGVEVHAVHEGYLMDQFATRYTNHRTDAYGGSLENRYRFATEVVKAIKAACGEEYPVTLRYSVTSKVIDFNVGAVPGEDYEEKGRDMKESEQAVRLLEQAGYDAFNADNGSYDSWYWAHPPVYMPLNCNLEDVSHIHSFVSVPIFCAGRMQPDAAAKAIAAGKIDGVAVARQFLADPAWLEKLRQGRENEIRPCISCHNGCLAVATWNGVGAAMKQQTAHRGGICALNPRTLQEKTHSILPAAQKKKVAIVGGGVAGMEAARVCALRGHSVTLYEKDDHLGGVFVAAAAPSFKEKDRELLAWYRRQLASLPVEVRLGTEIRSLDELEADEILIATGAKPRKIQVPGAERAITAVDCLLGRKSLGDRVAIVGGGLTGCEIAYELALKGHHPFIIEMQDDLVKAYGVCAANSNMLRDLIRYHKIPVYLNAGLQAIGTETVRITVNGHETELPAEDVVCSIGYIPCAELAKESTSDKVHLLGDASAVGNLMGAVWSAWELCMNL